MSRFVCIKGGQWKTKDSAPVESLPIQTRDCPNSLPRPIVEVAYKEYAAQHDTQQSLERLAERGGFGTTEIIILLYEHIERLDRMVKAAYKVQPVELVELSEAGELGRIAEKLDQVLTLLRPNTIQGARMTIWEALQNDPGLKEGYVSNIAMLIYDRLDGLEYKKRNDLANEILDLLFKPDAPTGE